MRSKYVLRTLLGCLVVAVVVAGLALGMRKVKADETSDFEPSFNFEFSAGGGGWLGIRLEEVTAENMGRYRLNEETGVIVQSVEKGSPAEKAGLRENDVILNYAGTPVISSSQLARLVRETPVSRTVSMGILREGSQQVLQVKIDGRSSTPFSGEIRKLAEDAAKLARDKSKAVELKTRERIILNRPRLGVSLEDLTDQMAAYFGVKDGVLITSVTEGSPAAKAGLRAGDVITAIDQTEVSQPSDLMRKIAEKKEGGTVTLTVVRDKRAMSITVLLEKLEDPARPRIRRTATGIRL